MFSAKKLKKNVFFYSENVPCRFYEKRKEDAELADEQRKIPPTEDCMALGKILRDKFIQMAKSNKFADNFELYDVGSMKNILDKRSERGKLFSQEYYTFNKRTESCKDLIESFLKKELKVS